MNIGSGENKQINVREDTNFTVRRTRSSGVIAAVLCLLLAVIVWLVVMQLEQTDTVGLSLKNAPDAYTCVLSDTMVDVRGTALALKALDTVEVVFPAWISAPGTYTLTAKDLDLPEGVVLAEELLLTVTVSEK